MQDSKLETANKPCIQLMRYLAHSPVSTGSVEGRWRQLKHPYLPLFISLASSQERYIRKIAQPGWFKQRVRPYKKHGRGMCQYNWIWTFDPIKKPRVEHAIQVALDGILEGNFTHPFFWKPIKTL